MKYPFVLTLMACVALLTVGQTPTGSSTASRCSLTREQAPELRGIRLAMSVEQLLSLFPENSHRQVITNAVKESKRADRFGLARFDLLLDREVANPRFAGVNYITVELIDERITSFHVAYAGPEWKSVDQFVTKLSEALRLPNSAWESGGESLQSLKCDGFRVDAYASNQIPASWVRVQDTSAYRVVEDRREAAKEKVREAFKP